MRNPEYLLFAAAGFVALLPLSAAISACTTSDAERREQTTSVAEEELITIKPRAGVECYIIPGFSSLNPRVMSCVVLPAGVQ